MAPKAKRGALKRPAAAVATRASSAGPSRKRPAGAEADAVGSGRSGGDGGGALTTRKCRAIINALEGVEELPKSVRDMLADLVGRSWGSAEGIREPYQEPLVRIVREALKEINARLQDTLREAKATVEDADAERTARANALEAAEARLHDLKEAIRDRRAELDEAEQAVPTSRGELRSLEKTLRGEEAVTRSLTAKIEQLQATETETYQSLKQAAATGEVEDKKLGLLRKVGKQFGFHAVLLDALPSVLKTLPERRRTFDDLALQQFEAEFAKHRRDLKAELKAAEIAVGERQAQIRAAETAVHEAQAKRDTKGSEVATAEEALEAGKTALQEARKKVRSFDTDVRRGPKNLARAEARLAAFESGPVAAFRELCSSTGADVGQQFAAEALLRDDAAPADSASSTERPLPATNATMALAVAEAAGPSRRGEYPKALAVAEAAAPAKRGVREGPGQVSYSSAQPREGPGQVSYSSAQPP